MTNNVYYEIHANNNNNDLKRIIKEIKSKYIATNIVRKLNGSFDNITIKIFDGEKLLKSTKVKE